MCQHVYSCWRAAALKSNGIGLLQWTCILSFWAGRTMVTCRHHCAFSNKASMAVVAVPAEFFSTLSILPPTILPLCAMCHMHFMDFLCHFPISFLTCVGIFISLHHFISSTACRRTFGRCVDGQTQITFLCAYSNVWTFPYLHTCIHHYLLKQTDRKQTWNRQKHETWNPHRQFLKNNNANVTVCVCIIFSFPMACISYLPFLPFLIPSHHYPNIN